MVRYKKALRCAIGDIFGKKDYHNIPRYYIVDNDINESLAVAVQTVRIGKLLRGLKKRGIRILKTKTYKALGCTGLFDTPLVVVDVQIMPTSKVRN